MPACYVFSSDAPRAQAWVLRLVDAGLASQWVAEAEPLLRQLGAKAERAAPQQVVVCGGLAELRGLLNACAGEPPCAVSLLAPWPDSAEVVPLVAQGLTGWWPEAERLTPAQLATALALDRSRWQTEAALRAELARSRGQLDERKWVDRAKGVLMTARGIGEDEAFRLLRGASMQANLRVGEVSRSVIEAAQWAEAINRAGQLRMLSQRLVKLAAQRLAGVDARRAKALQAEAAQRAQDNLDHLAALPLLAAESPAAWHQGLAATDAAWCALRDAQPARLTPEALQAMDQHADTLLAAAEALTDALQAGGARGALHIVNLCGRQRMRVQRLAKDALLASLLHQPARRDALLPLMDAFEATLLELEQAPLSSAEIRTTLAAARDEWLRLLRGLRDADGDEARAALAHAGDALLLLFDRLTASYERSLQVIMS